MEVTGKIIRVFDPQSGVSKTGNSWKKREYLLEIPNGQYPTQIFFHFFGDRADQFILTGGKEYRISFDISSREFNGRWYTDLRAWKAEEITGEPSSTNEPPRYNTTPNDFPASDPFGAAPTIAEGDIQQSATDDLPF